MFDKEFDTDVTRCTNGKVFTTEETNAALNCIRIALAIETLAYHNKNYLDRTISGSNAKISETVQGLLREAETLLTMAEKEPRK